MLYYSPDGLAPGRILRMTAPQSGSSTSGSAGSAAKRGVRPSPASAAERGLLRRLFRPALILITVVLVADALIGDKGLLEHRREARRHTAIQQELEQRRKENQELRVRARRLREEHPAAIEDLARRRLGMIKPGELLFVVKDADVPPAAPTAPAPPAAR